MVIYSINNKAPLTVTLYNSPKQIIDNMGAIVYIIYALDPMWITETRVQCHSVTRETNIKERFLECNITCVWLKAAHISLVPVL